LIAITTSITVLLVFLQRNNKSRSKTN